MTDTVVDEPAGPPAESSPRSRAGSPRGQWRPLLVRMHFYAGVLVAPFVFLACLTGMLFVFNPQLDRLMESRLLVVEPAGRTALPLNQQVAKAVASEPGLNVISVVPSGRPDETTRVNFFAPGAPAMTNHTVFVDPYSGEVRGAKDVSMHGGSMPFTAWLAQFHGDLGLGEFGRWHSELASLWLVVLTLGGLVVWWQRCAVHRKITSGTFWRKFAVVERGRHPGVRRTMSWHSTIGLWTAVLALGFGLTGLPFARTSGPKWMSVSTGASSMHASSVKLDPTLPGAQASSGRPGAHGQSGGTAHSGGMNGMNGMGMTTGLPSSAHADFDAMAAAARTAGVDRMIRFTAPTRPGVGWTVAENKTDWPVAYDSTVIDPTTYQVVRTLHWDRQTPALDKLNRYVMLFHFGRLFGFVGQIVFGLTMLGVLWIIWWGYRMWWQRRPRGSAWRFGKVPARGSWRKAPTVSLVIWTAVTLAVCWVFPVLGVSTAAFPVIDVIIGRVRAARRSPAPAAG